MLSNNLFFDDDDNFDVFSRLGPKKPEDPFIEMLNNAVNEATDGATEPEKVEGVNLFFVDEADNDFVNEHEIRIGMQREVDEMCLSGHEPSFNVLHFEDELQRRLRERRK